MKHLKHASEKLAKKHMKHLKTIATHSNIQRKHLHNMCETYAQHPGNTLATYV
jgi:hypothetical protein